MPKVSTTELSLFGRLKKFEVHYSPKKGEFFVKLPPEITCIIDDDPHEENESKAVQRGQDILRKFEQAQSNRRKVIVVHVRKDRKEDGWRLNGTRLDPVGFQIVVKILEETTVPGGSPMYFDPEQGRAVYLPADDFTPIPWSEERQAFFDALTARMKQARESLAEFIQRCAVAPELCTFATMPALMPTAEETK